MLIAIPLNAALGASDEDSDCAETTLPETSDANCATIVEVDLLRVVPVESADPAVLAGVLLHDRPGNSSIVPHSEQRSFLVALSPVTAALTIPPRNRLFRACDVDPHGTLRWTEPTEPSGVGRTQSEPPPKLRRVRNASPPPISPSDGRGESRAGSSRLTTTTFALSRSRMTLPQTAQMGRWQIPS